MSMKSDEVFVIENENLRSLPSRSLGDGLFGKTLEDALQTLIEKHPDVIPGKAIDPLSDDPPRFILLCREMPIRGWALDHLLVDQRGVLTLVEAKLIQNPESRREVIGQIMEYAANAVESWGNGQLRGRAADFWNKNGKDLDKVIREKFGEEIEVEDFWIAVEENLKRGKFRLIVAADELRPEVRRVIEYLNSEMSNAEVYGLELRCYGDDSKALVLVPNLVGQTQATADRKSRSESVTLWTVERLRSAYGQFPNAELGKRLLKILDWAKEKEFFLETTAKYPGFSLRGRKGDRIVTFQSSKSLDEGVIYCYINERPYPGGIQERDQLVEELKKQKLFEQDLDPINVISGRNLTKKLMELSDEELKDLLEMFSRFCMTRKDVN